MGGWGDAGLRHCTIAVRWDAGVDDRQCRGTCCLTRGWGSVDKPGDGWWRIGWARSWARSTGALPRGLRRFHVDERARRWGVVPFTAVLGAPFRRGHDFRAGLLFSIEPPSRARERLASTGYAEAASSPGPKGSTASAKARPKLHGLRQSLRRAQTEFSVTTHKTHNLRRNNLAPTHTRNAADTMKC